MMAAKPHHAEVRQCRIEERDRFVGFAFAGADLLLEVNPDGRIVTGLGARCHLIEGDITALSGKCLFDLVAPAEREYARRLFERAMRKNRIRPAWVSFITHDGREFPALIGACRVPSSPQSVFLSFLVAPPPRNVEGTDHAGGLLNQASFVKNLEARIEQAQRSGLDQQVTLLTIDGLGSALESLSGQQGEDIQRGLDAYLKAVSADGQSAAKLSDDRFGLIHTGDISSTEIQQDVAKILEANHAHALAQGVKSWAVDLSNSQLSPGDAARALVYTIQSFSQGMEQGVVGGSLDDNAKRMLSDTMERISRLRRTITKREFFIVFQPIVDLKTGRLHHLEALTRFDGFKSPAEFITFAESAGLIYDFDLMFARRVLEMMEHYCDTMPSVPDVAINVSAKTLKSSLFLSQFKSIVGAYGELSRKILIEVTETVHVGDFTQMNETLQELRRCGFRVCLDDVGAGSTSFQTLYQLPVDYAKIDGQFVRSALNSDRDRTMLSLLVDTCRQLGFAIVGEQVEDQAQAQILKELGVEYAQGYLFGKPIREFETFCRP